MDTSFIFSLRISSLKNIEVRIIAVDPAIYAVIYSIALSAFDDGNKAATGPSTMRAKSGMYSRSELRISTS